MNWTVAIVTAVFGGLVPAMLSLLENTFSSRKNAAIKLSFCSHWGVCIEDAFILPVVNGLMFNNLKASWQVVCLMAIPSLMVTWLAHRFWWPRPEHPVFSLHFRSHESSGGDVRFWHRDLSRVGWLHVAFMAGEVTLIALYIISPMPREAVIAVGAIMAFFPVVGVIEPAIVIAGKVNRVGALTAAGEWLLIAAVTYCKL